ncbi:hypothetical protein [Streptomyces halobius]|uniref:hypothetical protein n=1 Tax=Streptomyces halobius TaxID=2879846 RepID=UPI003872D824
MTGDEFVEPGDAGDSFGQVRGGQLAAGLVLELDVVVVFGPVVTDQQQQTLPKCVLVARRSLRKARRAA